MLLVRVVIREFKADAGFRRDGDVVENDLGAETGVDQSPLWW